VTLLHHIGQTLRELLQSVPLLAVRFLFLVSLIALLVWVLRLPDSETTPTGGARRWHENLKFGAALAILIQIVIYACL
jgi:hypothetical protein